MTRSAVGFFLGAWLLPSLCLAQAKPAPATPPTSVIAGVVVDTAGIPIVAASVHAAGGTPSAQTAADGSFRLEGLTPGALSVEVTREGYRMLAFDFRIEPGVTVSLRLTLTVAPPAPPPLPASPDSTPPTADPGAPVVMTADSTPAPDLPARRGRIRGSVIDSAGRPVFGATIAAVSTFQTTMSDSSGRFQLPPLETGLQFVRVRKLGYLAEYFPVTLEAGRTVGLTVRLRPAGQQLARVDVRAERNIQGFNERAARLNGLFIRREELQRRNASNVTDVLRGQNGITLSRNGEGQQVAFGRGMFTSLSSSCPMGIIIDGALMSAGRSQSFSIDQFVNVQDIRAMEVYKSGPQVPGEFQRAETNCGAIIVWTR